MSPTARAVTALASTVCLLASCSTPETPDAGSMPDHSPSSSPTPSGATASPPATPSSSPGKPTHWLPTVPAANAGTLARQLDRAAATLRAGDATAADVRSAAEFQQLAVRALARRSSAYYQQVSRRLHPDTSLAVASMVRAARSLQTITGAQERFPRWRIVAPPPAAELVGYYKLAQRRTGVPWTYLAAIHLVETRMGRIRGVSTAGARGPMQFLPSTWDVYGAPGDITDPRDAVLAAARLLEDHGAPADMAGALWHYNPSESYVGAVREYALTMRRSPSAYLGFWHWRVLYRHENGTYVLPVGYPKRRPVPLPGSGNQPAPQRPARGTVPPRWLGTRVLPETVHGYGEVRPTPGIMRVRRWNTHDSIPALPGHGFTAMVADPAPRRVIARSTWQHDCPVGADDLAWVRLTYWGFDDARHSGEMLVNGSVDDEVVEVFRRLYRARFPIESMGIARREDLDAPPTGDGNVTGSFACRPIRGGTTYSQHAYGLAVDLNPFQNPYRSGEVVLPELASAYLDRDWRRPGMITADSDAARAFASIGWEWGGDWSNLKDYQHFSLTGR